MDSEEMLRLEYAMLQDAGRRYGNCLERNRRERLDRIRAHQSRAGMRRGTYTECRGKAGSTQS